MTTHVTDPGSLPRRNDDVDIETFDAAYVVFDPRCMQVHLVDGFAAVVFDACDGTTTKDSLRDEICDVTDMRAETARDQIESALGQLVGLGLLEGTVPEERPP